jgi:hypothetical protein
MEAEQAEQRAQEEKRQKKMVSREQQISRDMAMAVELQLENSQVHPVSIPTLFDSVLAGEEEREGGRGAGGERGGPRDDGAHGLWGLWEQQKLTWLDLLSF